MNQIKKNLLIVLPCIVIFLSSSVTAEAQKETTITKFYFQTAVGGGNFGNNSSDLGVQAIIKNKWSLSLSYQALDMRPNNIPNDYIPATGTGEFFIIPYSYSKGVDNVSMKLVNFTGGKYFKLSRSIWATTEAGVSFVHGEKTKFRSIPVTSGTSYYVLGWEDYTTSNYEATVGNKNTIGAMLKADINWAFASFMGIGGGVYANVNSIQSPVGFHIKLIFGLMGKEKKHRG